MNTSFETIIIEHLNRYPQSEIQDLYKLIFQAAMGCEHAIADSHSARLWLDREVKDVCDDRQDPLFEPISPGGLLVRVNIRPFLRAGCHPDLLFEAFLRTSHEFKGSLLKLKEYWDAAMGLSENEGIPFRPGMLRQYWEEITSQGFPAMHHSKHYVTHYRPSYRVVLSSLLPVIFNV